MGIRPLAASAPVLARSCVWRMTFRFTPRWGAVCLPKAGESVPGDAWKMVSYGDHTKILVADGLGHGPDAAKAAIATTNVLKRHADATPLALIEECHAALRSTRGAAVGIVGLDPARE